MLALRENPESQSSDRDKACFFSLALRICNTPSAPPALRGASEAALQIERVNRASPAQNEIRTNRTPLSGETLMAGIGR
jgi:hypothetical protein